VIFVLAFLHDFTLYMVEPTFTIYALSLGASMTIIAVMNSVSDSTRLLTAIPIGKISDKRGRRPFVISWRGTAAITYFIYSISSNVNHLILGKGIWGINSSLSQVSVRSYLADIVHRSKLHIVMGIYTFSLGMGVILGPLFGGRLIEEIGFEGTYLIAGIIGVISFIIAIMGTKETKPKDTDITEKNNIINDIKSIMQNRLVFSVILLASINLILYKVMVEYVPAYLQGIGFSTVAISDLFVIRGIFTTMIRLPIGIISTRIGNWKLIMIGIGIQVIALIGTPFSIDYTYQMVMMSLLGLGFGIAFLSSTTYLLLIVESETRGITLGVLAMISGGIGIAYGPLRGIIADTFGIESAFIIMAASVGIFTLSVFGYNSIKGTNKEDLMGINK